MVDNVTLELREDEKVTVSKEATKILKKHGLDYSILKVPLVGEYRTADGNGIFLLPTKEFGLFHSKSQECLNVTKDTYRVSQNEEIIELALKGMEGFGELSISKAGSLDGGRKTFVQLAIAGDAKVGNDTIKRFITIIDSNDGSTGLSIGVGDLTMSCQNMFYRFYKAGEMKIRHRQLMSEKISEVPRLIQLALSESLKLTKTYEKFQKTKITQATIDEFVKVVFGINRKEASELPFTAQNVKKANNMEKLYNNIAIEVKEKGMNLWGLHSGATRWTTHEKQAPNRPNGRLEGIIVSSGTNYKANQKSLKFALEKAKIKL